MNKIKLEIAKLNQSNSQHGSYTLTLGEEVGNRKLIIVIGHAEAQSIAVELEGMHPARPLTHDLFRNFAVEFGIQVDEIVIYNFKEGIFYAKIVCSQGSEIREIDSRSSDAIAIALRFNCPIYTFEFILASVGVSTDDDIEVQKPKALKKANPKKSIEGVASSNESVFASMNSADLKSALMQAIDEEDYETASKIRDELTKRKEL
jgi:hypothetical protein